jgi:hypothetical protein
VQFDVLNTWGAIIHVVVAVVVVAALSRVVYSREAIVTLSKSGWQSTNCDREMQIMFVVDFLLSVAPLHSGQ